MAQQQRYEDDKWIPKEENTSSIVQFRTISLLSVECKTNSLTVFLLNFACLDPLLWKGGVSTGVLGCIEHTDMVKPADQRGTGEQG